MMSTHETTDTLPQPEPWMTIQQAAAYCGVHPNTIRRAIWRGALAASQPGAIRMIRIFVSDLENWRRQKPATPS